VVDGVRMQWGEAFANHLGDKEGLVSRVINHQVDVVQFAMPYGSRPDHQQWRVDVSNSGHADGVPAALIGRATQSMPGLQGESWLLTTATTGAGAGTRVRVLSRQCNAQKVCLFL